MVRLRRRDADPVRKLVANLRNMAEGTAALSFAVPALHTLLGAEKVVAYGLAQRGEGLAVDFAYAEGLPAELFKGALDGWLEDKVVGWGLYNPIHPEPPQRNVALTTLELARMTGRDPRETPVMLQMAPICRFDDRDMLRALVCDGPSLLAWVGAFRREPFTERESRILTATIPDLRRRMKLERQLASSSLHESAFIAALESLPAAAFLVDTRTHIRHANDAGRTLLDRDRLGVVRDLRAALAEPRSHSSFSMTRIAASGLTDHYLAVHVAAPNDPTPRVEVAADRWRLTRRQREVLNCMARGLTNKTIAASLGCAENTVELHVSAILEKAGARSRSVLVARFWTSL